MEGLVLSGLGRRFGQVDAVLDVDLALKPGEFVSLLGPSGCGKTTTLRMIAGFIDPTGGSISLNGKLLSAPSGSLPPEKRGMSMIFQSYAIWPNMTVSENVAFGLKLRKLPAEEVRRRVGEILEVVRLGALSERYPAELSGGQQQRVALARAVVIRPEVLLLDEPLSNLDANLREEMRFEIKRIHDEFRITSVYVTHDQGEAMVTSDRIAVMHQGRIEQVDEPYALYTRPKTRFVASFIGRTNFLTGRRENGSVVFDAFSLPADMLGVAASSARDIFVSIRPQSLRLCEEEPVVANKVKLRGQVVERAFLGERGTTSLPAKMTCAFGSSRLPPTSLRSAGRLGFKWTQHKSSRFREIARPPVVVGIVGRGVSHAASFPGSVDVRPYHLRRGYRSAFRLHHPG